MIDKVRIRGYRKFRDLSFAPSKGANIFVGDNESGKSTILEAIGLALTCRIHGRPAAEELNPYWFNTQDVKEFFDARKAGKPAVPPTICIELFLEDTGELVRLHGAHNSESRTRACPGICFSVEPDPEYENELEAHFDSDSTIVPVEYYRVHWRSFADNHLAAKPRELTIATIDSKTVRSSGGVDYHLRQILGDHLTSQERAAVSLAYRSAKEQMTKQHLAPVNNKMAVLESSLHGEKLALAMDQSSRTSWDASITPQIESVPFGMSGQGQQAAVKIALAMGRSSGSARIVMIEEPENHLSHTSLNKLIGRITGLMVEGQQLFITTHSSFVLNRLGLDGLQLVSGGRVSKLGSVSPETVEYFRRMPGYDTLRLVLARVFALVEGPSDEILFERFYKDRFGRRPIEDGIDVVSMRSLSLKRCLELASTLGKRCAALRDLDENDPVELAEELKDFLKTGERELFLGEKASGNTLEPQLIAANGEATLRRVLEITPRANVLTWMTNNKTEAALLIADSSEKLTPPSYFSEAIDFVNGAK